MCGICGFWSNSLGSTCTEKNIELMIHGLKHRGPDGQGKINLENDRLYFGHTRLSILDLSESGKQPMTYRNRYTISYNGEIFNFIELRKELTTLGHSFTSNTDTEVILAAYAQWGSDCLLKFNGMWAFAIWDSVEKVLFLSRDRYGIKPLYYSYGSNRCFCFASETIAFKRLKDFAPQKSEVLVNMYLKNPSKPESDGLTIYENIRQVKPGHSITVRNNGNSTVETRWWDQSKHLVEVPERYEDQTEKFKELFFDSCKLRLRSDVPIASAVSGGLDSSSIFASLNNRDFHHYISKENRIPNLFNKGFFVSFPDTYSDEKYYAEKVFKHSGSKFSTIIHRPYDLINLVEKTTKHFDTIYCTPLAAITPLYEEMASEDYKISMDGHGVDEMLFGYKDMLLQLSNVSKDESHFQYSDSILRVAHSLVSNPNATILNPLHNHIPKHTIPLSAKLKISCGKFRQALLPWIKSQVKDTGIKSLGPNKPPRKFESFDPITQEFFFQTTLPTILRNFDRASMYHGVEVRMPFMDYRLVSFVMSLPTSSKIKNGYTKAILRDSMKGILPDSIRQRKWKVGISAPLANWFSKPSFNCYIKDIVHSGSFQNASLWNGKMWKKKISHLKTEKDWEPHANNLWRLINASILLHH